MKSESLRALVAFIVALLIIFATATIIGEENKSKWFKKRTKSLFLNRRGFLGDKWNFGHPVTWQGYVVFLVMFPLIFAVGYLLIFMF